jgi:acyl-CoA synthetase (AMP-forming)/AMP-acid ligase II
VTAPHRTPKPPPHRATTGALIRHAANQNGDATLVVRGDRRLTYRDAERESAALALGLLRAGAGKGTRVGLLAPNGPDWVVGWLAATRIGAVTSLLNTYHRARELSRVLRHGDTQILLTADRHLDHDYLARLEEIMAVEGQRHDRLALLSHPFLRSVSVWGEADREWCGSVEDLVARGRELDPLLLDAIEEEVSPADPAVIVYSSGTTADPKGVIHSHGAMVRHPHNLWQFRDLAVGDVVYTPMPLFWVGGLSVTLIAAMHAGATLVFEERFEPEATLKLLERERVTQVLGWPHMGAALANHRTFRDRDLSSIRAATLPQLLPPDKRAGDPTLRPNSLGMTETLGPHTIGDPDEQLRPEKRGSFGRPVPGVEHRIVDLLTGEDCAPGELGELWVRGSSVMLGLYKREREEVFTSDGWYRSGDGGYFDAEGHFYFKGRLGEQIKSSGVNVTPREVELVLEEQPEVQMAIVMGVPHPQRGEDVAAAVVLTPGTQVGADTLRERVKNELASYKVPRHVALFEDQADLPWVGSGKVDRRAVHALLMRRFGESRESLEAQ